MRVIDAVRETIADVSSAICSNEGLVLETSAIVSFTVSITLINTQLITPVCKLKWGFQL